MAEQLYAVWVTDLDTGKGRWSGAEWGSKAGSAPDIGDKEFAEHQLVLWRQNIEMGVYRNETLAVEVRPYPQGYTEGPEAKSGIASWLPDGWKDAAFGTAIKTAAKFLKDTPTPAAQLEMLAALNETCFLNNEDAEKVTHNLGPDLALALFVTDPEVIEDMEESLECNVGDLIYERYLPQMKAGLRRAFKADRNGWTSRAEHRANEIIAALEALSKE